MVERGDVLKQYDSIKESFQSGQYERIDHFDILMSNMDKMVEFYEQNDCWGRIAYGVNESLPFISLFVMTIACVEFASVEDLLDCQKFFDYVDNWFRENFDRYEGKRDVGEFMTRKCAEELSEILKNEN